MSLMKHYSFDSMTVSSSNCLLEQRAGWLKGRREENPDLSRGWPGIPGDTTLTCNVAPVGDKGLLPPNYT